MDIQIDNCGGKPDIVQYAGNVEVHRCYCWSKAPRSRCHHTITPGDNQWRRDAVAQLCKIHHSCQRLIRPCRQFAKHVTRLSLKLTHRDSHRIKLFTLKKQVTITEYNFRNDGKCQNLQMSPTYFLRQFLLFQRYKKFTFVTFKKQVNAAERNFVSFR